MRLPALQYAAYIALFAVRLSAQTTLHTTTSLVLVPTLVETGDQQLVFSLKAEDFSVTDNGIPQKIRLEDEIARPVSLVVIIQTSQSARGQFPSFSGLDGMLASLLGPAPNEVSIVNFDSTIEGASPFTSNVQEWKDAIDHPDAGDKGAAIFDALAYGIRLLDARPANHRRAILLISQEHDDSSKTTMRDIVQDLAETNTAIYSVTFPVEMTEFKQAFKDPPHLNPPIVANESAGPTQGYFKLDAPLSMIFGAMRKNTSAEVATLSGGESMSFDGRGELERDLDVLANHLHNSYLLSFSPTSSKPGLHTIAVRLIGHPGMVVSARSSYWASDTSGK